MSATAWASGSRRLWSLDQKILPALAHHRLMTARQLRELVAPSVSIRWVRESLVKLATADLVAYVPTADRHTRAWFITPAGREAVGEEVPARRYVMTDRKARSLLQEHLLTANDVGVAFARHALSAGHEMGPLDWDHEIAFPISDRTKARFANLTTADLVVRCLVHAPGLGSLAVTRLVEIDRSTETPHRLMDKVRAYRAMLHYVPPAQRRRGGEPAWRSRWMLFPKVVFVFAGGPSARLDRRVDQLAHLCRSDPLVRADVFELGVYLTLLDRLVETGPFQPIFRTPAHPDDQRVDLLGRS